jgi:hypothetical protein
MFAAQEEYHMSKRYTAQQKEDVLRCLQANNGSVMLTSIQTGVSERTIRSWRQRIHMEKQLSDNSNEERQQQKENVRRRQQQQKEDETLYGHDTSCPNDRNQNDEDETPAQFAELKKLRQTIMNHIFDLAADLSSDDELVSQRAIAISRLLDRIPKLDAQIKSLSPENGKYQIEYIHKGKVYDAPPWQSDDYQNLWEQDTALFADYQSPKEETEDDQNNN